MEKKDKLVDINTAAAILTVSPGTVRTLLRDPFCPLRGTKIGRSIRIWRSSIDALLEDGEARLLEL